MRCWLLSHLAPAPAPVPAPTQPLSSGTALAHDSKYGNPLRLTAILRAYFVAVFSFLSFCFVFGLILSATKSMMIKLKRSGERKWKAKKLERRRRDPNGYSSDFISIWFNFNSLATHDDDELYLCYSSLFLTLSLSFSLAISLSLPALWSSKMKPKLTHL